MEIESKIENLLSESNIIEKLISKNLTRENFEFSLDISLGNKYVDAKTRKEVIEEIADILEVIDFILDKNLLII